MNENQLKEVEIFSDGACSGNPGPGGWGSIIRFKGTEKTLSGGEADTTNNRMELMGAIVALETLKENCRVTAFTDSQYIANAFLKGWLESWQKNGWKTAGKKPVKNQDLWQRLLIQTTRHSIEWKWVKGHAGHPENERCDELAVAERDKFARKS